MPPPSNQPFPFPPSPPLEHWPGANAIRKYLDIFLQRRNERPGGKFADADISEFMRLAEHLDKVTEIEMDFIADELLERRAELFANEAQKARLRIFIRNHQERNSVAGRDAFVKEVFKVPSIRYFRDAEAFQMMAKTQELSNAIEAAREFYIEQGSDSPELVDAVNNLSDELADFIDGFSLSDVDDGGRTAREARRRDLANYFRRIDGKVDHEAKWDADARKWLNWNRDIAVFPVDYLGGDVDLSLAGVAAAVRDHDPVRMVAGGHAFNTSSDTGGSASARLGALITLDRLKLAGGVQWNRMPEAAAAQRYHLQDGSHVVTVSAGMRLRDFTEEAWAEGMALPVAGSTDAQSIGGLLATDLHSTGHSAGFLSQQTLEVTALDHTGEAHTFLKNDSVAHGQDGRWTWTQPGGVTRNLRKLPPAGAIGMAGVVVEAVLKLGPSFAFLKNEQFVPREWVEDNIGRLLDPGEMDPLFAYQHVSMYYSGGFGANIKSVQLNTWKRTSLTPPPDALRVKRQRELTDHIGSAFFPNLLFDLAKEDPPSPGTNQGGDSTLRSLNNRPPQVLQANHAFARKLYFQHDEIEAGIPLVPLVGGKPDYRIFREAIKATQELLQDEELKTIIEIRFTPDVSEAMLGPGTGGPTCYIELATSMALYSRERIVQVFQKFDKLMREEFGARPHLGKKTSAKAEDMAEIYGADWVTFNEVRDAMDPGGKFRPAGNEFLRRVFG